MILKVGKNALQYQEGPGGEMKAVRPSGEKGSGVRGANC